MQTAILILLGVRQVGKASDFDSDMHRFESYSSCQVLRPRSSVVEHRLDKARVGGSFPPGGTKFLLTVTAVDYIIALSEGGQDGNAADC